MTRARLGCSLRLSLPSFFVCFSPARKVRLLSRPSPSLASFLVSIEQICNGFLDYIPGILKRGGCVFLLLLRFPMTSIELFTPWNLRSTWLVSTEIWLVKHIKLTASVHKDYSFYSLTFDLTLKQSISDQYEQKPPDMIARGYIHLFLGNHF